MNARFFPFASIAAASVMVLSATASARGGHHHDSHTHHHLRGPSHAHWHRSLAQRAQRADGLLGFIFDQPGADVMPVERVSSRSGQVATAHATPERGGLRVSGLVRRNSIVEPPHGAHVDVLIVDPRGKIIASAATEYLPRSIPRRIRGSIGQSHYTARFPSLPPPGSSVQVRFHPTPITNCPRASRA